MLFITETRQVTPKGTNWGLAEAWAFVAATDQRGFARASGGPHVAAVTTQLLSVSVFLLVDLKWAWGVIQHHAY